MHRKTAVAWLIKHEKGEGCRLIVRLKDTAHAKLAEGTFAEKSTGTHPAAGDFRQPEAGSSAGRLDVRPGREGQRG